MFRSGVPINPRRPTNAPTTATSLRFSGTSGPRKRCNSVFRGAVAGPLRQLLRFLASRPELGGHLGRTGVCRRSKARPANLGPICPRVTVSSAPAPCVCRITPGAGASRRDDLYQTLRDVLSRSGVPPGHGTLLANGVTRGQPRGGLTGAPA